MEKWKFDIPFNTLGGMNFSFKASSEAFFPNVHLSSVILTLFQYLEPNWHELRKQEKCSSLASPRNKFYKTQ